MFWCTDVRQRLTSADIDAWLRMFLTAKEDVDRTPHEMREATALAEATRPRIERILGHRCDFQRSPSALPVPCGSHVRLLSPVRLGNRLIPRLRMSNSTIPTTNSSDLGMGTGPKLKSDEFLEFTKLVIEMG